MNSSNLAAMLGLAFLAPAGPHRDAASPAPVLANDPADSTAAVIAALRERWGAQADSALLTLTRGSHPQLQTASFRSRMFRTWRAIDDAAVRGVEESLDRVDSARTAAEWRRVYRDDSIVAVQRAKLGPRKARPERRRKGGGDMEQEQRGEPKTPPMRDRTERDFTELPEGPKGSDRTGKTITEISYANWELFSQTSVHVTTSQDLPEAKWQIGQANSSKARVGVCPDESGIVRGSFEFRPFDQRFQITEPGSGKLMTAIISLRITGTFGGRVNDQAELANYDVDADIDAKVETIESRSGKEAVVKLIGWGRGSATQTGVPWNGTSGNSGSTPVTYTTDPDRSDAAAKNSFDAAAVTGALRWASALLVDPLLSQASSMWKNGECLKLTLDPVGPLVLPSGAPAHIDATLLEHRQTDERLDLPITVRGGGVSGLRPEVGKAPFGVDLRLQSRGADATAYVSGGIVNFEVRSRRGGVREAVYLEPDDLDAGYLITYRTVTRSEKEGISRDVGYRAVVRLLPQPDEDGNNYGGKGNYEVMAVQKKANCLNDFPDDYERIRGMGTVKATASVSPGAGSYATVVFSLEPLDGPRAYMFTKSFRFMDKAMQSETGTTDADQPLIAFGTAGMIELDSDSVHQSRESEVGSSVCLGKVTQMSTLDIVRLK